jgi:hypothetical protein
MTEITYDAIDRLTGLGYSEREASFLYIVAVHSGYFLRRQFNRFVARERGAIATHFLRKAIELGHVNAMPCAEGRFVYHLAGKKVYGLIGHGGSQGRRIKSLRDVLRRLMVLDYVLLHLDGERFVETKQARQELFERLGVRPDAIKSAEEFGHTVPVSFVETTGAMTIRFVFIDEGQRSSAMFSRFLRTHSNLLRSRPGAAVVYVAISPTPFAQAAYVFKRHMPLRNSCSPACPQGVEHLIHWLEARHKFHDQRVMIDPPTHRLLLEGEYLYTAPVHQALIASWEHGAMNADKVRKMFRTEEHRTSFMTELIASDYPRSLDPTPGYSAGYKELQNDLFGKDLDQGKQEEVKP